MSDKDWAWWYDNNSPIRDSEAKMHVQVIRGNSVVMLEALERIGGDRDR